MTIVVTPDKMVRALASSVSAGKDAAASGDNPNRELKDAMVAKNFFTDSGGGTGGNDPRFPDATTAATVLTYKGNGQYAWEITGGGYNPPPETSTPPGTTAPPAERGPLMGFSSRKNPTDDGLDTDFFNSTGFLAKPKDKIIVTNSTSGSYIYTRKFGTVLVGGLSVWENTTKLYVNGDAVIQGTLAVDSLVDGKMTVNGGEFGLGRTTGSVTVAGVTYSGAVYGKGTTDSAVGGFFTSQTGVALLAATVKDDMPAVSAHNRHDIDYTGAGTAAYLGLGDRAGQFNYWGNNNNYSKINVLLGTPTTAGIFTYATSQSTVSNWAHLVTETHAAMFNGQVGPFTGSHDALVVQAELDNMEPGDIVCDRSVYAKQSLIDTVTVVEASNSPNEKSAVGVYYLKGDYTAPGLQDSGYDRDTYQLISIASVGEGQINVTGENGNLEPGDLITTSSSRGKGMRQDDDIVRSYTVAKCRETVVFDSPDQVKQVACIYMCG
jgi:hypothetical protein